jgi:hypothetical protein
LEKKSFYPSIIPTNSNFFNYLILLSLSSSPSSHQLPITLFRNGQVSLTKVDRDKKKTILPAPSTHEIPLVLAWMRTISIQPSISTLAVALVMWGEVCARVDAHHGPFSTSPVVDVRTDIGIEDTLLEGPAQQMGRKLKPGEQQYVVLVSYLREWVGEERLPHWKTLEKWRVLLKRMRDSDGDGDDEDELEGWRDAEREAK